MISRKFLFTIFLLVTSYSLLVTDIFAKEITILYTGETHAMLYPCNCPKEPDGGIARRAALIKQLRKDYPDSLLLDSGGFFAGGLLDEYTQNTQLDSRRSLVNLKAMELMGYDALALGDDEFNFGREFFQKNISKTNLTVLSCNISADNFGEKAGLVKPYIIKEISGVKIGIIGVTNLTASQKAEGVKFTEPKTAVAAQVAELKERGVNIIVLLSHLGEREDVSLINDIAGIDILIAGHGYDREKPFTKIANTLILRPAWQGRRLGKVSFTVENNKITNPNVDRLRLSDKITDDPDILSILPRCFSDANCKKETGTGVCQDPGTLNSRCLFSKVNKVDLLVITTKDCATCGSEMVVNFLKKEFPGLAVSYLYYPDRKSDRLIKDFAIYGLPAYLLGKEIEKEKNFDTLKANLEEKSDFYMLKPQFGGVSYFLNRKKIKGKFDLFLSLFDKDSMQLLDRIREFNPAIHFLAVDQQGKLDAPGGNLEVEEYLRAVCVQKNYPGYFWDYITCRTKSISSSWWEDCAAYLDANKIKTCAKSSEGNSLLRENINLNKELQIISGPTYLVDNQEIFGSNGVPSKEELRKIIKR